MLLPVCITLREVKNPFQPEKCRLQLDIYTVKNTDMKFTWKITFSIHIFFEKCDKVHL